MADQSIDSPKQTRISPRNIRILIVALVVAGFLVKEKTRNIVEHYRGTATIQVSLGMNGDILDSGIGIRDAGDQNSDIGSYPRRLNTIVHSLANTDLMKQVIVDHDLLNNEAFAGRDASSASLEFLARNLAARTRASLREGTELIDVSISDTDRGLARNLVNWIAEGVVKQRANRRLNTHRYATGVLTNEAERLKIKLRNAEVALIDFRRTSKLVVSLEDRHSILSSRIVSLNQSQEGVDAVLARLEADMQLVKSFGDEPTASQFEQVRSIWDSEEVQRNRNLLHEVDMKLEEAMLKYSESHPALTSAKTKLKRLEDRIFESMKKQASGLEADYRKLKVERDTINEQLIRAENESLRLSEIAVEYNVLEREVEGTKALYFSVLDRIKEIDLTAGLADEVITIIEPASFVSPTSGRESSRLWQSGLIGLVLALTGVYLFDNPPYRLKRKN